MGEIAAADESIPLRFTDDEALALSDWIHALQNTDPDPVDLPVWPALYAVDASFTGSSPLIFAPDYTDRLASARERLRAGAPSPGTGYDAVLTTDQAVALAHWLRGLLSGAGPFDESLRRTFRRLRTILPAAAPDTATRRRLLSSMGRNIDGIPFEDLRTHRHRSPIPLVQATDLAEGWIFEQNVVRFLTTLSHYIGYRYDHADEDALIGALDGTDDDSEAAWFRYPLMGEPSLEVALARSVGGSAVSVQVTGAIDPILHARIDTMLHLL